MDDEAEALDAPPGRQSRLAREVQVGKLNVALRLALRLLVEDIDPLVLRRGHLEVGRVHAVRGILLLRQSMERDLPTDAWRRRRVGARGQKNYESNRSSLHRRGRYSRS